MKCGLLGEKLGHSYSPQIHSYLGDYEYKLFEKAPEELEDFLLHGDFQGLNVTIPYKKSVIPYCDVLTDTAKELGAVNTIVRLPDGKLLGHNSDCFGFRSMLQCSGLKLEGKKVLVLGSGGASATAVAVLRKAGANVIVISRNGENNYNNLHLHRDAAAIVNATPVGMYPQVGVSPIDLDMFPDLLGVLDIVYNPARTKLLLDAMDHGLITENGLWMLVAQAKESAEFFLDTSISDDCIAKIHRKLRSQMENIVLIGMPGCGKSTIGQLLQAQTHMSFVDADAYLVEKACKPIPQIFAEGGEEAFRKLETEVLSELGKRSGLIIATGGGCVTRPENYRHLHQNGTIFWLQRDIQKLPKDGRPLSQAGDLTLMYQKREPLYRSFADHIMDNNASPEATVSTILSMEGRI